MSGQPAQYEEIKVRMVVGVCDLANTSGANTLDMIAIVRNAHGVRLLTM